MTDRYYTPVWLAEAVADRLPTEVQSCVDPACGRGDLLNAVARRHPHARIAGFDIDDSAIEALRASCPRWELGVANMLDWMQPEGLEYEWVVMNPPYSCRGGAGRRYKIGDREVRCSTAMAHVLAVASTLRPRGGIIGVLPESMFFAERDAVGRELLEQTFRVSFGDSFSVGFAPERPRVVVATLRPGDCVSAVRAAAGTRRIVTEGCRVVRGGLPVFEARDAKSGVPYIHTRILSGRSPARTVEPIGRGVVHGGVVLLPRVGVPIAGALGPHHFNRAVQLSDCLIALYGGDDEATHRLSRAIKHSLPELCANYRGTGARHITLARLAQYLESLGWTSEVVMNRDLAGTSRIPTRRVSEGLARPA